MEIGIYKIVNQINGNFYVGSSKNIRRRWKEHLQKLKSNNHQNILLQRSWNKYGENNFRFEIHAVLRFNLIKYERGEI
jgi:group I intron endonuclease